MIRGWHAPLTGSLRQVTFDGDAASLISHLIRVAPVFDSPPPIHRLPICIKSKGDACAALSCYVLRSPERKAMHVSHLGKRHPANQREFCDQIG